MVRKVYRVISQQAANTGRIEQTVVLYWTLHVLE